MGFSIEILKIPVAWHEAIQVFPINFLFFSIRIQALNDGDGLSPDESRVIGVFLSCRPSRRFCIRGNSGESSSIIIPYITRGSISGNSAEIAISTSLLSTAERLRIAQKLIWKWEKVLLFFSIGTLERPSNVALALGSVYEYKRRISLPDLLISHHGNCKLVPMAFSINPAEEWNSRPCNFHPHFTEHRDLSPDLMPGRNDNALHAQIFRGKFSIARR